MNRASLFQAMEINPARGQKEPMMNTIRANGKYPSEGFSTNRVATVGFSGYPVPPKQHSGVVDYSTRNGVKPCFNINRFVLRNPPQYKASHGLMALGGQSRTQNPSIANRRPLNLPILHPRSNLNASLPSSIGIAMTV
tara:strand:- start:519 stop:932 length:414 start_codon:yes stop_codon:yes gene_type:complete